MKDLEHIKFACDLCGGHVLSVEDGIGDAGPLHCKACGTSYGTFGQLKADRVNSAMTVILGQVAVALMANGLRPRRLS